MNPDTIRSLIRNINDKNTPRELKLRYVEILRDELQVPKLKFGWKLSMVLIGKPATTCDWCGCTFKSSYVGILHQLGFHNLKILDSKIEGILSMYNTNAENDFEGDVQPGPSTSGSSKRLSNSVDNNKSYVTIKKSKYDELTANNMPQLKNSKEKLEKIDPEKIKEWKNGYLQIKKLITEILNASQFTENRRKYMKFLKDIDSSKDRIIFGHSLFSSIKREPCTTCPICKQEFKQAVTCAEHLVTIHRLLLNGNNQENDVDNDDDNNDGDGDDDDDDDDGEEEEDLDDEEDETFKYPDKQRGIKNNSTSTEKNLEKSTKFTSSNRINIIDPQSAKYIKNIYSPHIFKELIRDVDRSYFSLIVNGLINLDKKNLSVLFIRYFSKKQNQIVTVFYRLHEMPLASHLINSMKNDGLKTQYFLGLGIDNESVDIAEMQRISTSLREAVSQNIVINKYIYNTLFHIIVNSGKFFPANLMWIIKETYEWFSNENRMNIYNKNVYNLIMIDDLQNFIESPDEYWIYYVKCIQLISNNWTQLSNHFETVKNQENDSITTILCDQYTKNINQLYFEFIHKSLNSLVELDNELQTNKEYYPMRILCPLENNFKCNFDESINEKDKEKFLVTCEEFLKVLNMKLENLTSGDSIILGKISDFLQNNITIDDVIALIERFPYISDVNRVMDQWFSVEDSDYNVETVVNQWIINPKKFNEFENISKFALSLLCLPVSNTETKSVYSIINKINNAMNIKKEKTVERSIFSAPMLEALLRYFYVPAVIFNENVSSIAETTRIEDLTEEDIATCNLVNMFCKIGDM